MSKGEYVETMSQSIRQLADSDEALNSQIRAEVFRSIRNDMGYWDLDPDTYRDVQKNRHWEIIHHIAGTVRDEIWDYAMLDIPEGFGRLLFGELFDYGNVMLWEDIAEAYVPEPDDYEEDYNG